MTFEGISMSTYYNSKLLIYIYILYNFFLLLDSLMLMISTLQMKTESECGQGIPHSHTADEEERLTTSEKKTIKVKQPVLSLSLSIKMIAKILYTV